MADRALGVQRVGVEVDHDLPRFPAVGRRNGGSLDGGQLGSYEIQPVVEELRLGQGLAVERQLENRHAGGVVLDDRGGKDAGRKDPSEAAGVGVDLGHGHLDLRVGLEINAQHAHAVERLRFHVFDVVDGRREGPLGHGGDAAFHLLRRNAAVGPDHADDRNVDHGENVGRGRVDGDRTQEGDGYRHHDKRIRSCQRDADYPHSSLPANDAMVVGEPYSRLNPAAELKIHTTTQRLIVGVRRLDAAFPAAPRRRR